MERERNGRAWLVKLRQNSGMSTYKAAQKAGISQSYYSKIELGWRNVPVPTAKKISAALGFDWKRFYE